ncbi:hypothetical protein MHC_04615 [Mycoplasma haemocanis str. Illinois]|uniref:Uncharacterized protein n=1 Tax=Mycoplasma haemocanis (strain Illinois) TaxID=1111676 RepID=H6N807_MYCHN|nr:hypothetical protein [Mycoplasma haemocanis]AEW45779.1 hypothetical protein MHC_04615 [Mycoplasma haemocanis str. Illinois]
MNLTHLLLSVGSIGAASTGVYLTRNSWLPSSESEKTSKKSLSQILMDNKYKPLDTSKSEKWGEVLKEYKKAYSTEQKTEEQLRNECKLLLDKEDFVSEDYKRARRWCIESQSVSKRLEFFGKKALSTVESESRDDNDWKTKISNHNQASNNKLGDNFGNSETQNLKDIKDKCKVLNAKTNTDDNFDDDFSKSMAWCSVASS